MAAKSTYNPLIHHRRSIRLKGYDYAKEGLYFITMVCERRTNRFGNIENGKMQLNEYGQIAYDEWIKLFDRFSNFQLDVFQIMPNHVHSIISLTDNSAFVGAGFTPAPTGYDKLDDKDNRATVKVAPTTSPSIADIIGAYKSLVSNECLNLYKSKNKIMGKLWQRNYWEHIIRDERAYQNISSYIINNPAKWQEDKFNLK